MVKKVTSYAAACSNDKVGGKAESSAGGDPRKFTLEKWKKGEAPYVMAAAPQSGGTASLYRCLINMKVPGIDKPVPVRVLDHYGTGSNGASKLDISRACENSEKGIGENVKITIVGCPNGKHGTQNVDFKDDGRKSWLEDKGSGKKGDDDDGDDDDDDGNDDGDDD